MRSLALALCMCVTCAQAETFAERWPAVEAVQPVAVARTDVRQTVGTTVSVRRHTFRHAQARFVCHRQYYTVNKWRYWRCQR